MNTVPVEAHFALGGGADHRLHRDRSAGRPAFFLLANFFSRTTRSVCLQNSRQDRRYENSAAKVARRELAESPCCRPPTRKIWCRCGAGLRDYTEDEITSRANYYAMILVDHEIGRIRGPDAAGLTDDTLVVRRCWAITARC